MIDKLIQRWIFAPLFCLVIVTTALPGFCQAEETSAGRPVLLAGVAKREITDRQNGPVLDPCFAKALVLKSGETTAVLVAVDAVAIGEIGRIGNEFLGEVRRSLQAELGIAPASVVINASHCHGIVRKDSADLVVAAVKEAAAHLVPVRIGAGVGHESRISENRRLKMKDGSEIDMRRAYSMPRDEEVAEVGPIDSQIGLLRLDREDGRPFALVYQYACHPIMNPPSRGNSADFPYYASRLIEEGLGGEAMALFIQGCGGDINPVRYKETAHPPDAEPLGNLLGLSTLQAARKIETRGSADLKIRREILSLPRGTDLEARIEAIHAEQIRLVAALTPTNINFKTFVPLFLEQKLSPDFPSHFSQSYLHDEQIQRPALRQHDADTKGAVEAYLQNIQIMERMTRLNTNLALLKMHLAQNRAAANPLLDVELVALRVGDFRLLTFPGELTVQIGLNIKQTAQQPHTFVSGYTNGYIYYAPTAEQRRNTGYAQEDCDCLVAPEWQKIFEMRAIEMLKKL